MVQININGQSPNNGGKPSSNAARGSTQRRGSPGAADADYSKAEMQRNRQDRSDDRAWRDHQRREEAGARKLDSLMQREIRAREQQVAYEEQRAREARRLTHRLGLLESRAAGTFTPSTYAATRRAIGTLDFQSSEFRRRYGVSPFSNNALPSMISGMGTEANAHKTANIMRLGSIGQRYAEDRSWTSLAKVEAELRKIDRNIKRQTQFMLSPSERANVARQEAAMLQSRSRISAGLGGMSSGRVLAGRAWGMAGMALESPIAGLAMSTAALAATAGYDTNKLYSGVLAAGRPYRDFDLSNIRAGLAGGFNGRRLTNSLLGGPGAYLDPAAALPRRLAAYGLAPSDVPKLGAAYGVPFHSARAARHFAESATLASLSPGMGLSADTLAKMAGTAQTVFGMKPNEYWRKLQEVQTMASRRGLDSSSVAAGFRAVLGAAAGAAGGVNVNRLGSWYQRMLSSDSAIMRNGGAANYLQGMNTALGNVMGGGPAAVAMSMYFRTHAMPTTATGMQHMLGVSPEQWATITQGGGGKAWANYQAAMRAGNKQMAYSYLGILLQNHPREWNKIINGGLGRVMPGYMLTAVKSRINNVSLPAELGYEAAPSHVSHRGHVPPGVPRNIMPIAEWAAKRNGVPLGVMLATLGKESSFRANAQNGNAIGLGQIIPSGGLASYNKAHPNATFSASDMRNPVFNAQVSAWYLAHEHARRGGSWTQAYVHGYHGLHVGEVLPGGHIVTQADIDSDRRTFNRFRTQYSQVAAAQSQMRANAHQNASDLKGSEYLAKEGRGVTAVLMKGFNELSKISSTLAHNFHELNAETEQRIHLEKQMQHTAHPQAHPVMAPWAYSAMPVPHAMIPNDMSHRITK